MSVAMAAISAVKISHLTVMLKLFALTVWVYSLVSVSFHTINTFNMVTGGNGSTLMQSYLCYTTLLCTNPLMASHSGTLAREDAGHKW